MLPSASITATIPTMIKDRQEFTKRKFSPAGRINRLHAEMIRFAYFLKVYLISLLQLNSFSTQKAIFIVQLDKKKLVLMKFSGI